MSMYFIGIDISKYKHDCCIISTADQKVVSKVTITSHTLFLVINSNKDCVKTSIFDHHMISVSIIGMVMIVSL